MVGERLRPATRVVVVDDHPIFRDGLRAALHGVEDIEVVGEAPDAATALTVVEALSPDVVLLDLHLPDASGVEVLARLQAVPTVPRVLVVTMSQDDDAVVAVMRAGARGYVVKGAGRAELLQAVRTVAGGGAVFGPGVAERLERWFAGLSSATGREAFPALTEREREVLTLMSRGLDNRRIARELFLSEKTVRNHVSNLLGKLGVADRSDAIARARSAGLG
jgi:DNA-binding NarL/FixJ family response regulator